MKANLRRSLKLLFKETRALLLSSFPRSSNVWVLSTEHPSYGNVSAFARFLRVNNFDGIRFVVVITNRYNFELAKGIGLDVLYKSDIKARWFGLIAKYHITDGGFTFYETLGPTVIYLWHGIPLKKIALNNPYELQTKTQVLPIPWMREKILLRNIRKPDFLLTPPATFSKNLLRGAFGVSIDQCLPFGYCRMDDVFHSRINVPVRLIADNPDAHFYAYFPTFRDSGENPITAAAHDWQLLNDGLRENDAYMFVKPHPATDIDDKTFDRFDRLLLVRQEIDSYSLFPYINGLITDYSSIYLDFLLMNKKVFFFPYDLEEYTRTCRNLYFDYDSFTPGPKVQTTKHLLEVLFEDELPAWRSKREGLVSQVWGDYRGDACEKLQNFIYHHGR